MRRVASVIALLLGTGVLFWPTSSNASFPGNNGRIAFWSLGADEQILGIQADGTDLRVIATSASQPAWSPRGNRIAFTVTDQNTGSGSIWVARADGTHRHRVTGHNWDASQPSWAPDGNEIVFIRYSGGDTDVAIVDLATGDEHVVRNNSAFEFEPSWSPDGSLIAFSSDRLAGRQNIYVIAPDGSNLVRLTDSDYDSQPNWSPDGTMIAFQSDRADPGNNYDIYRMQADGSNVVRLTKLSGTDAHPSWSPNGTKIAYARRQTAIIVMNIDGSSKARIYGDVSAIVSNPDWRPLPVG
jgi:tol-pal system beta propeller repeat protein TolB